MTKLRFSIIETFYAWIKLKLPDQVFENLVSECQILMELVFQELYSSDEENLTNAVSTIVELISLSSKKKQYQSILQFVIARVESLQAHVKIVVENGDTEVAEQFSEIFAELAMSHL